MTEHHRVAVSRLSEDRLVRNLDHANMPALVMALHQLTGDETWLSAPFRPRRAVGMSANDTGGFDEATRARVVAAAAAALRRWARGADVAIPQPDPDRMRRMMAACAAETEIPPDYAAMMEQELGFDAGGSPEVVDEVRAGFRTVVIGAGIGGVLTAHLLQEAGIPVVVLERQDDVGGTWQSHRYPGAGVDTPSHLYSFSFFSRDWSGYFAKQGEVLDYVRDFVERFDLRPLIRFGVEVTGARFDEDRQQWDVGYRDREGAVHTVTADALVSAVGLFGLAQVPDLPGADGFSGELFHSTRWPADLDLRGKRVAVVGSGATAMQVVPAIVDQVESLTVLQKSAMWVAPSEEYFRRVPPEVDWLFHHVPFYREWYRFQLAWTWNDQLYPSLLADPEWEHPERSLNARNDAHRAYFTRYITEQLAGRPDLIEKAVPRYPPFAKRMLVDNGWYVALKRPHVELLDERLVRLGERTVVGDGGTERECDVVALCTGYQTSRYLAPMDIRGRGGRSLREDWGDDDARAHLGITVPGYPNLFLVYGPNTNGAGGSYFSFAQSQVSYIRQLIRWLATGEAGAVEPRRERFEEYNRVLDEELARRVWAHPGVDSYYRNSRGRITANRPWSVVDYWSLIRRPDPADFELEPVASRGSGAGRGVA